MGLLFCCQALAMCIIIVSGLNENAVRSENGESGLSNMNVGENGGSDGGLQFLPGGRPGSGNNAGFGPTGNELPNGNNPIGHPTPLPWNITKIGKRPKRCMEPPEKGVCRAFMPTWYFDIKLQLCRIFIYGGCGGNDNQFSREKKCQEVCLPGKIPKPVCGLQPVPGKTQAFCRRWHFDANFGTCSLFSNHKCAKNANGFYTCRQCMKRCSILKATEVCQLARQSTTAPRMQQQQQTANRSSAIMSLASTNAE
ncbi:papilin isoform X2 [Rhipicephalus sanguineus]|uniref:papilin isoform X2 n=1 Tax=Rhipicephalus sanguineus TaxID=34632 RepID=UPI0018942BD2|nr:papilin isoform X2 [Rhipicephalus sanguineus]